MQTPLIQHRGEWTSFQPRVSRSLGSLPRARTPGLRPGSINGLGRREPVPQSYFPRAQQRYATAVRGITTEETRNVGGTLKGLAGGCPWMESARMFHVQSQTIKLFDALINKQPVETDDPEELLKSMIDRPPMEQMRAWVNAAAPPLVYDAARARHQQMPVTQWRDELAARYRARPKDDSLKPIGPPNHRKMKERLEREIADAWAAKEAVQRKRVEKANAKLKKAEAAAAAAGTSSIKSPLDRNEFLAKTMGETPAEVGSRPASRGEASARSGTSSPKSQRPSSRG